MSGSGDNDPGAARRSRQERMDRLIDSLSDFLRDETTHPSDIDMLEQFLARPLNVERMSPILSHEDIARRLDLIRATGYVDRDSTSLENQWTPLKLAIVMIMPISALELICNPPITPMFLPSSPVITRVDEFIVLFLQMNRYDIRPADAAPEGNNPAGPKKSPGKSSKSPGKSTNPAAEKATRREPESDKAKEYDGFRCVLTGTSDPESCHIVPFSINSSKASFERIFPCVEIRWLLDNPGYEVPKHLDLLQSVACSDYSWNIISINPQMHKWWSEGFWGFKCLGVTTLGDHSIGKGKAKEDPNTTPVVMGRIRLQFFWAKKCAPVVTKRGKRLRTDNHEQRQTYWRRPMKLDEAFDVVADWKWRKTYGDSKRIRRGWVGLAANMENCRLLQERTIIELERPYQDCVKMKVMIDLQYAAIQIASLSGAAYSDEYRNRDIDAERLEAQRRREAPWFY